MRAEENLLRQFAALYDVLNDIGRDRQGWDAFWPTFEALRRLLRHQEDRSLAAGALLELEHAAQSARAERVDRTRHFISSASAKLGWTQ